MISTLVLAAALIGGYEPVPGLELHKVPGPAFLIPCKVEAAEVVAVVQLYVSADRGKTWTLHEEIKPVKGASFMFVAKKAGEYWFAPRIQKKDGAYLPTELRELEAAQRVAVATGSGDEDGPPVVPQQRVAVVRNTIDELDEELTRIELEMIRKEIKRLGESNALTPDVEEKIDRLRGRLREVRDRARRDNRDPLVIGPTRQPVPFGPELPRPTPVPSIPPMVDDSRLPLPPSEVPTITPPPAPVPVRPVAPPPRAPEPRS